MGRVWDKVTGTKYPDRGIKPLPTMELREALLALGGPDALFRVRHAFPKEKADLVAERRIAKLDLTVKIRLRLVPGTREVRTLEEQWGNLSHEYSGSRQYGRGGSTRIAREWEFQKGPDGRRRLVETFRYDSRDMKDPLRNTVLAAGWTWRGVLFRW
ncbi:MULTISPECIES: hypothetical protein [Streptomyces]|uniref:hypothetical protein n=1 Tax=Streptomyces TaxID=1883 RepID=UPI000F6F0011|nr:hypothetical protein [Streptomyces sp. W1SF4]AZM90886.1 hypothetical protein D1J60_22495 [Streptomyces sp. W1SF4]